MKLFITIMLGSAICLAQAVPGPTLPAPVSTKALSGYKNYFMPAVVATVPLSGTISTAVQLKGFSLVGLLLPSSFTSATISFLASIDGTNFFILKNTTSGTTLTYTVTAGTFLAINPVDFYGVNYLKITTASSEAAQRTLNLALKGL